MAQLAQLASHIHKKVVVDTKKDVVEEVHVEHLFCLQGPQQIMELVVGSLHQHHQQSIQKK
jgi:hypothetical protein